MNHRNVSASNNEQPRAPFWVTRRGARVALAMLYACTAAVVIIEAIHPFGGDGHGVERVHALEFLASYAIYGFVACVVLVLLGRLLRRLVMRGSNYYGEREQ